MQRFHEASPMPHTLAQQTSDKRMGYVICGSTFCRIAVWTEQEWLELEESEKPSHCVHVHGLGWVGAVPLHGVN
jgi:hypothetical protein